jgi:serine/threonine protein kinase
MMSLLKFALYSLAITPALSTPFRQPEESSPGWTRNTKDVLGQELESRGNAPQKLVIDGLEVTQLKRIGSGDYGVVYKGIANKDGEDIAVAVKVCQAKGGDPGGIIKACQNEVGVMQELHDKIPEGIPEIYASKTTEQDDFISFASVIQLGLGGSVDQSIERYYDHESAKNKKNTIVHMWKTAKEMHASDWAHRDL